MARPAKRANPASGRPIYKTNPSVRSAAALLDGLVACVPAVLCLFFGQFYLAVLLASAYILIRDALPVSELGYRSVGKRLLNLTVQLRETGVERLHPFDSVKRNIPLVAGALISPAIGLLPGGGIIAPLVAVAGPAIEAVLVFTDAEGRRLGDRLADTRVLD